MLILLNARIEEAAREAAKLEFMHRDDDYAPPPEATITQREGQWVALIPFGGYAYRVGDEAQAKLFKATFDAHCAELCGG